MAGRAGRRGKDVKGYVVAVQSPFEGAADVFSLLARGADPLQSQFTPTYGMVLNLLQKKTLPEAQELVRRSFSQYLAQQRRERSFSSVEKGDLFLEHMHLKTQLEGVDWGAVLRYEKLLQRLKAEERLLNYLAIEAEEMRLVHINDANEETETEFDNEDPPELEAQRARVARVEEEIEANPVHLRSDRHNLLKKRSRLEELESTLKQEKRKGNREDRYTRQERREAADDVWKDFMAVVEILQHFRCLDEHKPTPTGETCAAARGENELWLGITLGSDVFASLPPPCLAAACSSLVADMSRSDAWCVYTASDTVQDVLDNISPVRDRLLSLQDEKGIGLPVILERDMIGLVERWAEGVTWPELCANTSLDEGDVFRLLRRTLDVLAQIPHLPNVIESLKRNARKAYFLCDRFPISEIVQSAVDDIPVEALKEEILAEEEVESSELEERELELELELEEDDEDEEEDEDEIELEKDGEIELEEEGDIALVGVIEANGEEEEAEPTI
mmetsp:Transcript_7524/g.11985  ORF Transcript_7524/g.11985 Transcript_7524/m.11985 type:complete len:504 (-) Transcript_7524:107-1618(-)